MMKPLILMFFVSLMFVVVSCRDDDDGCTNNNDCGIGEFCVNGNCDEIFWNNSDTSSSSDSAADTVVGSDANPDSDSVFDTNTASGSDTNTDSASDTNTDSETVPSIVHECISNEECDDDNPCTSDFCNTSTVPFVCDTTDKMNGTFCDDTDPCNGRETCEDGVCTSSETPCVSSTPVNGCVQYVATCTPDGDALCAYTTAPVADGTPCLNTTSCTPGTCSAGECTNIQNPCAELAEKCVESSCEVTGPATSDYTCHTTPVPDGRSCLFPQSENICYETGDEDHLFAGHCYTNGDTSTCYLGDRRSCYDSTSPSICSAQVCQSTDGSCLDIPKADVSVSAECGETVAIFEEDFVTRQYYSYSPSCFPIDVRGKEVALLLSIPAATDVIVTVVNDGGQDISLHHLTDMCDPNTCQSNAYDALSITGMLPTDAILVEAGLGAPPVGIELSVSCN